MLREIKFCGKRTYNDEWVYGDSVHQGIFTLGNGQEINTGTFYIREQNGLTEIIPETIRESRIIGGE